jgi:hypothetical protein
MTPAQKKIYDYLELVKDGLFVNELIRLTGQNDVRKRVSEMVRDGYEIKKQYQQKGTIKLVKYYL